MTRAGRGVVWFNRALLAAATFIMLSIAVRNLSDPIGASLPLDIALRSPTAVTIARVGFGGFPLGIAIALFGCLVSTDRLLTGVLLLLATVGGVTAARVEGLFVDGATPYNLGLLRPELAMIALAIIGASLELRRRRRTPA